MEVNSPKDVGPRKALGRGLAALIPGASSTTGGAQRTLPIERIRPNASQPRKNFQEASLLELASSIRDRGVLQPIIVRRQGDNYELVAGERRWRAASKAGLKEIPAIIKELTDADLLQVALIENLQREDLDPLEEAAAYLRLIEKHELDQQQVASAVGKSRSAVANSLRLLKLPESVLRLLAAGELTAGHARALLSIRSDSDAIQMANRIVERKMSVRDAERAARQLGKSPKTASVDSRTPAERHVEERLQAALGTKVRLRHRNGKGRIEIDFHSLEHLDGLLEKMTP